MRKTVACLGLALVAACAPADTSGTGNRIRVQVSGDPEETAVYERMVEAFEEENPDIDVNLVKVVDKDDHLAKLTTAFAGGDAPEVFLVNFREYSQFVVRDAIEPIEPLLDQEGVSLDSYYPHPLDAFTYDDELQCMPQNISSLVVYYNLDLFDRAGLKPPAAGWGWEEFRQTAGALTQGDVHGLGIEPNIIRLAPFVWSNGGGIVDDLESPTRFTLEEPAAREAVQFVLSLVREDKVVPGEADIESHDLETRFAAGKLGMLLSSRRETPVFRELPELNWDVAPLPVGKEPAGVLHSDAYCISRGSDRLDAAVRFIAFATGRKGQTITALGGRTVPSLKEVSRSPAFLDPTRPPRHSRVFLDGIPYIQRTPVILTWPEIEDVSEEIFTRAFYEPGYTLDDALRELDAATRPLFEEAAQA